MRAFRGDSIAGDLLDYHFGFGAFGPARRGKRLRPRLLTAVTRAEGGDDAKALLAAAAVEMLHNYSLIHDDIEDRDELRHGKPALWKRFGLAQALNAGDALCAASFLTLAESKSGYPPERVLRMIEVLHGAHGVMCDGQSMDLAFEEAEFVTLSNYERMIAGKTAALFGAACEIGALCAAADLEAARAYRSVGRAYGLAFQIRDDVLGIWASSDATGKVGATDIARRKWTFPVVWALSLAHSPARDAIASAYAARSPLSAGKVDAVVDALDTLRAREAAESAIEAHLDGVRGHEAPEVRAYLASTLDARLTA
ncbi:MAG: polyprenyl synthetase family protein [Candidatus Eremiobacteraeota bacterium]|nr:polyprenyl synthetase family protein [Candidatus Eremiobacteraeota bacterium]